MRQTQSQRLMKSSIRYSLGWYIYPKAFYYFTMFFSLTILPSDNTIPTVLDRPLILTPEFGPGVTPGARLTRVVPLCVGAIPHQWPRSPRTPEHEIASTNWRHP
nr:hypothetical protein [Tanacetum cinerariifolium]